MIENEKEDIIEKEQTNGGREIYWVLGGATVLIILVFIAYSVMQNMKVFEYEGLVFTEEKFGQIEVYKYSYYPEKPTITGRVTDENPAVVFYFRTDPRNNNVSINVNNVVFPNGADVYVTYKGIELEQCEYNLLAASNMAAILSRGGIRLKSGLGEKEIATANNITYVTCEEFPNDIVVQVESSNETKVVQEGSCYRIKVSNCEILEATEKFVVEALAQAVERKNNP